jgi:hypothetical protein
MKFTFLLIVTLLAACTREDHAGTVGSGAGIQEEEVMQRDSESGELEKKERMDAGGEDMNITTPIYDDQEN